MPLVVNIMPVGVREVMVTGDDAAEQDLALLVWPFVRHHLDRLDATLKAEAPELLRRLRDAEARVGGA